MRNAFVLLSFRILILIVVNMNTHKREEENSSKELNEVFLTGVLNQ
jgi:hypothetical protein